MKAISLKQPHLNLILLEIKTIETRNWKTKHRGDILLVASKHSDETNGPDLHNKYPELDNLLDLPGKAICVVELYDVIPMDKKHEFKACCPIYDNAQAWMIRNVRPVKPFPVKGALNLFDVDDSLIEFEMPIDPPVDDDHFYEPKPEEFTSIPDDHDTTYDDPEGLITETDPEAEELPPTAEETPIQNPADLVEPIKERTGIWEYHDMPFNDVEKISIGAEMAELQLEIERVEQEKKEINSELGEKIKDLSKKCLELAKKLDAGFLKKEVECFWRLDYPHTGLKTLFVMGTDKAIREEGMQLFDTPANVPLQKDNESTEENPDGNRIQLDTTENPEPTMFEQEMQPAETAHEE